MERWSNKEAVEVGCSFELKMTCYFALLPCLYLGDTTTDFQFETLKYIWENEITYCNSENYVTIILNRRVATFFGKPSLETVPK